MLKNILSFIGVIAISIAMVSFNSPITNIPDVGTCQEDGGPWNKEVKYYDECWYYTSFQFIEISCNPDVSGSCHFLFCDLEWEGCRLVTP